MTLRMLVVDEQKSVRFAIAEYFRVQGYDVDCARTLRQAQAMLGLSEYALIIGDLYTRGEDGSEGVRLLRYIREHHPATRIIALSQHAPKEWEGSCEADVVVQTPKSLAEIAELAMRLLDVA